MNNLIGAIVLTIMLLLLLPANNASHLTSPEDNLYLDKSVSKKGVKQKTNSPNQSELCPILLELPIMLGRPAPCFENYTIGK